MTPWPGKERLAMAAESSQNAGLIAELAAALYETAQQYARYSLPYRWEYLTTDAQRAWLGMARVAVRHIDKGLAVPTEPAGGQQP